MSTTTRWVVLDLRMHDNELHVVDPDSDVQRTEHALVEELHGPHELVGTSAAEHHSLTFCVTTDLDGLFAHARETAPRHGVASLTALVWRRDPREDAGTPERYELVGAQPPARGLGRGQDRVLAELLRRGPSPSPN